MRELNPIDRCQLIAARKLNKLAVDLIYALLDSSSLKTFQFWENW